jgi:hypothetical protein
MGREISPRGGEFGFQRRDRCFILKKPQGARGLEKKEKIPLLFLDSHPAAPYLVCVVKPHHNIGYLK